MRLSCPPRCAAAVAELADALDSGSSGSISRGGSTPLSRISLTRGRGLARENGGFEAVSRFDVRDSSDRIIR